MGQAWSGEISQVASWKERHLCFSGFSLVYVMEDFAQRPGLEHILVKILSLVELTDLKNAQLVSKSWYNLINNVQGIWINQVKYLILKHGSGIPTYPITLDTLKHLRKSATIDEIKLTILYLTKIVYEEITLERNWWSGYLLFTIGGGVGNCRLPNDPSIYVTKIGTGGAADRDKRLLVDDIILK